MRLLYPSPYRELAVAGPLPVRRVRYGPASDQWVELRVPRDAASPPPVVVLVHGGFWKRSWHADLMNALAVWLAHRGLASWNVEYRRVGVRGGDAAACVADVIAAVDSLRAATAGAPIDAARMVLVGHSAGGHLALLAARRAVARPRGVVGLAAVSDLVAAADARLGDGAAQALLGGEPAELADRYREASPIEQLPLGVPQLVVHGVRDQAVPVSMSSLYAQRARAAGDDVELAVLAATGHAELIDPASPCWPERILPWIRDHLR
ncbi:MAG TPA: prolyl oligopeptidase family serine peptidase [Candidatus Dormibacteraeota bacterium]